MRATHSISLMCTAIGILSSSTVPLQARRSVGAARSLRPSAYRRPGVGPAVCALSVKAAQTTAAQPAHQRPQPSSTSAKAAVLSHLLHFLPFWKEQDHVDSDDQSVSRELLIDTVEKAVEVSSCPPLFLAALCGVKFSLAVFEKAIPVPHCTQLHLLLS